MLDPKRILQLGIGVAVGMIAFHFIQKAMTKEVTAVPVVATLQGLTCEIHRHYFGDIPLIELIRNRTLRA